MPSIVVVDWSFQFLLMMSIFPSHHDAADEERHQMLDNLSILQQSPSELLLLKNVASHHNLADHHAGDIHELFDGIEKPLNRVSKGKDHRYAKSCVGTNCPLRSRARRAIESFSRSAGRVRRQYSTRGLLVVLLPQRQSSEVL